MPRVKKAKFVEWWAHSRQHCYGHQIHYDSIPGEKKGIPKHPIISTITFLTAECGGPTLITDQTIEKKKTTKGWVVYPEKNRLICFNGNALHLVLRKDIRRRKSKLEVAGTVPEILLAREVDLGPTVQAETDYASGADAFDDKVRFHSDLDTAASQGDFSLRLDHFNDGPFASHVGGTDFSMVVLQGRAGRIHHRGFPFFEVLVER